MTDPLFVFLNVLSLWGYIRSREPGAGKSRLAFSYAAMGLAVLTKGPFGMFPACVFVLSEGLQLRSFGRWIKESVLRHAAFSFISILIAAPWFLYTFSIQRGATENFFFYDNLLRVLKGSEGHTGPLSYYLPVLLGGLLPWSFFFFPLVGEEWKNRKRGTWTMDPEFSLLALWVCSLFVFFSVTANKLPHYMLPVVPAAACLLGRFWRDRIQGTSSGSDLPLKWTSGLLILLTLAPAALYFVRPQYASLRLSAPFLVMTMSVMFARYLAARNDWRRSFITVCFGTILFLTILFHAALPWVEQFRVMKPIGLAIREQVPAQARLVGYRVSEPSLFIYGGRTFPKLEGELLGKILSSSEPTYVVTTESLLNAEAGNVPHRVLARAEGFAENGGETTIVLAANGGEPR
jgi:4-amino-4-deoxy-L-arabinose transferase-like glycosyltransferase